MTYLAKEEPLRVGNIDDLLRVHRAQLNELTEQVKELDDELKKLAEKDVSERHPAEHASITEKKKMVEKAVEVVNAAIEAVLAEKRYKAAR